MTIEFLDPSYEGQATSIALAPRLRTLRGAVVAIVSNGKKNTVPFFDAFADELLTVYEVQEVVRITKNNYSTPVDAELLNDAERWNAMIAGIGD